MLLYELVAILILLLFLLIQVIDLLLNPVAIRKVLLGHFLVHPKLFFYGFESIETGRVSVEESDICGNRLQ